MTVTLFIICLCLIGFTNVWDGWFSLVTHGKDTRQTFWHDHIFRFFRVGTGLLAIYLAWLFGMAIR